MASFDEDVRVNGNLSAGSMTIPDDTVGDATFSAGDPLTTPKQYHVYPRLYSQPNGTASVDYRAVFHVALHNGSIEQFFAGNLTTAVAPSIATIQLYKNGVSVLSGAIVLDSANTTSAPETVAPSTPNYVAGDVFEIGIVNTGAGTKPQGVYVGAEFQEKGA